MCQIAKHYVPFLLLISLGCSTRVEVSAESRTRSEGVQKLDTRVEIGVLGEVPQQPSSAGKEEPPHPSSPPVELPKPLQEQPVPSVEVLGTENLTVVVEGDLHLHQHYHQHLHLEDGSRKEQPKQPEPKLVEKRTPKPVIQPLSPECQRLLKEYQEQVKRWEALMKLDTFQGWNLWQSRRTRCFV